MKIFKELGLADIFSILNALSGFFGISFMLHGFNNLIFNFLYFSTLMDGMDGFIANRVGKSKLGKDLDSLADIISFGVFPSLILVNFGFSWIGALYLVTALLRLARFNVLSKENFVGLPTLASALTLSCWIKLELPYLEMIAVILSILMISDFEYMRIKNRIVLLLCGVVIVANAFTIYAVWILLLMLMLYISSPGVITLARRISKPG